MLIKDIINETTSAGAVATVAMPLGKMQKRPNPSVFSIKKKKKNEQIAEQQEIPTLDELKNDTMQRSINNVRTSYSKIAQEPWFEEVYNRALELLKTSNNKFEFRSLLHVLIKQR